jgi:CRISPR-associated protein Cas5d
MSYGVQCRVRGPWACFTRPEMKAERVSYDVMTPSAARGVLEAVYWKPQMRWVVDRIRVLAPIRWMNVRRNEVGEKIRMGNVHEALRASMRGGRCVGDRLGLVIERERQQRAATILRDVDYIVEAHVEVLSHSGPETKPEAKHLDQFNRRLATGQCFHRPYLGCREFACDVAPVDGAVPPCPEELRGRHDLGYMLLDFDFADRTTPLFFRAVLVDGVLGTERDGAFRPIPSPNDPEVRR